MIFLRMANPMLLWFVGYSNITSIAIVTFCFIAMTIFIGFVSVNGDYSSRSRLPVGVEQRNMVKVTNPFFLKLEQQNKKLSDGLKLHLSSLLPSQVFVLWGVRINPLHDLILKPGKYIRHMLVAERMELFQDLDILHCDKMKLGKPGEHNISLHCPDVVSSETLGDTPRLRYPAAVFIFVPEEPGSGEDPDGTDNGDDFNMRPDDGLNDSNMSATSHATQNSSEENEGDNEIVGLMSIIHLRDDKVPQYSHIISQYVKTAGVPIYSLQPLYMSGESNSGTGRQQNQEGRTVHDRDQSSPEYSNCGQNRRDGSSNTAKGKTNSQQMPEEGEHPSVDSDNSEHMESQPETRICSFCGNETAGQGKLRERHRKLQTSADKQNISGVCRNCSECKNLPAGATSEVDSENSSAQSTKCSDKEENEFSIKMSSGVRDGRDSSNNPQLNLHFTAQPECVVCQAHHVRCALLPCRHACVCIGCFKLLDRCPMCRGAIETYFLLSGDDEADDVTDEEEEDDVLQDIEHGAVNTSVAEMWHRFNARLNELLGFR